MWDDVVKAARQGGTGRLRARQRLLLVGSLLVASRCGAQIPSKPGTQDAEFAAATAAYRAGKFSEAGARLEALERKLPESFEVHELLGLTYSAESQDAKAVQELQTATQLDGHSVAAKTNLAIALLHTGKSQAAEAELHQALALEPYAYSANHNLAELYLRENRVSEAIGPLERAQQARPTAYDNGYDLALAYLVSGRTQDAKQRAETLLKQQNTGELHNLLGRVDEKEGAYLDAAKEFATAAHMDPSEENLFVWASELLLHRTYQPAIEVFRDATQRFPKSPRLWIGLGMSLYSRGEYEPAVQSLVTAADLDPRDARCYLFLSKAYLSSPNQASAVIDRFRRYADLEPTSALAQYYYALGLWRGRRLATGDVDYRAVESLLKKAIALDPTLADAHLQLGILYTDQHEDAASLPEYERAVQLEPDSPDAHFRLGRYYLRAGDKERAATELDLFKTLHARQQAEVDKERAAVEQFVVANNAAAAQQP